MRGSSALRTSVAPGGALAGPWARNPLWTRARAVPSLDLCFADTKSLVCATTGQNLVTHTRASSATFVGSDGVLRTATTNLLLRSEEFNDATWSKVNTTVTANSIAAPNGTVTADTITDSNDVSAAIHSATSQNQSYTSGLSYTLSVYARAGTQPGMALLFPAAAFTSNLMAVFNISTGTIVSLDSGMTGSIVAVGNGWYRCSATATATTTASSSTAVQIRIATASTSFYQGNGTGTISLWGAQLEQSSTVGEYIPTTSTINSAPRFDHNPQTGESLGLLVEEARTNSIRNNTMVGAVAGTPGTAPTNWAIAQNGITGLSFSVIGTGTENGITYIDVRINGTPSGSAAQGVQILFDTSAGISASASQTWTESVYYKLSAGSVTNIPNFRLNMQQYNAGVFIQSNSTVVTAPSATLTRVAATSTFSASTTTHTLPLLAFETIGGAAIDFTLRIGLPQLEQGAFATSVIPTTTAAATRAADVAQITGSNFSSWYNQTEGTVFMGYLPIGLRTSYPLSIDDGTTNNFIGFAFDSGASRFGRIDTSGVTQVSITQGFVSVGSESRGSMAFALNNVAASFNGSAPTADTSVTIPTVDRARLHALGGSTTFAFNGHIRRLTYWPTRLGNEVLQRITQ